MKQGKNLKTKRFHLFKNHLNQNGKAKNMAMIAGHLLQCSSELV